MATAASIEVIIRARDEASAAVSASLQRISTEAKGAQTAVAGIGRAGAAAGAVTDLVKNLDQGTESVGGMVSSLGSMAAMLGGPWGLAIAGASQLVGAWISRMEEAKKEQAAFTAAMAQMGAQAEQVSAQRDALAAQSADRRAQALRAAGDPAGAAAAMEEATEKLRERYDKQQKAIDAAQRKAEEAFKKKFPTREVPPEQREEFDERRKLLAEQYDEAERRRAEAAAQQQDAFDKKRAADEERAAQRRAQMQLQEIEGERAIAVAVAESEARRAEADAKRRGHIEDTVQAQLTGILRVREAELAAIRESANARAAAATGPGREEEVLAIRRAEERQTRLTNLRASGQAAGVAEQAQAARARQEREREAARQAEERRIDVQMSDLSTGVKNVGLAARTGGSVEERIEAVQLQRDFDLLEIDTRKRREIEAANRDLYGKRGDQLAAAGGPGTPLKVLTDAQGNVTIAQDFEKAAKSAGELTDKVKELSGALKEMQVEPGFATKLSQDLADTLQFLGARNP